MNVSIPVFSYDDLETIEKGGKRHYKTPEGIFPSVTTFLSEMSDSKEGLNEWRNQVGEVESERISKHASNRGNIVHDLCEKYLKNERIDNTDIFPAYFKIFESMIPELDKITPYHMEKAIYSTIFKLAGRVDCIGLYEGIPSIIDFKTSSDLKKEHWIYDYYHQATCYSYMLENLTGCRFEQIVIIVGVHGEKTPQVFIDNRKTYKKGLFNKIQKFNVINT